MIKRTLIGLSLLFCLVMTPALATAQSSGVFSIDEQCAKAPDSAVCQERNQSTNPISGSNGIVLNATRFIAVIAGVVSVIVIIISGIRFITSSGDPQSVTAARNTLLYAVIGLVVVIVAQALVAFIVTNI